MAEARALLDPDEQGWLLGAHDMLVSWNMASFGRLDEAEVAARSSIERFDAVGEAILVVNALNALAGIIAAKGDVEGASVAYEVLLRRCRASGDHPYLNTALVALAALRARQGDDAAADDLYQEAIRCSFNPWLSADAIVGQAAVARRLGDPARAKRLLDTAADRYREADIPAGQPRVLAGLAWWALGAGQPDSAAIFASDAVSTAQAIADPETQLLADSALAAAKAIADPTRAPRRQLRLTRAAANPRSGASLSHRRARSARAFRSPDTTHYLNFCSPQPGLKRLCVHPRLGHFRVIGNLALAGSPQHHLRAASALMLNLTVMHQDQQPHGRDGQRFSDGLAVEDHGRVVTANMQAAAFYRQAQRAADSARTVSAFVTRSMPTQPLDSPSPISTQSHKQVRAPSVTTR